MQIGAIVLGRMDSSRLPGKVLWRVGELPLLGFTIGAARQVVPTERVIVATSERPVDDPIVDYCRAYDVPCFRGDLDNVAGRTLACAQQFGLDYFFRMNADSPFVSVGLLCRAVKAIVSGPDLVTNLLWREYPYGVSVEAVNTVTFTHAFECMNTQEHFEHVTRYIYQNKDAYRCIQLRPERHGDLSAARLTIDTPEDLAWFKEYVAVHRPQGFTLDQFVELDYLQAIETRCLEMEL